MLVFKFGGASVKDAAAVRNMANILGSFEEQIVVVVSAMGKMTNAFEGVIEDYVNKEEEKVEDQLELISSYHLAIVEDLFENRNSTIYMELDSLFENLRKQLAIEPSLNFDYDYDRLIGFGEMLSTKIVAAYLNHSGMKTKWLDVRDSLKTDQHFREGKIDWELSTERVGERFCFENERFIVTQGFLASNMNNQTVSLGREGSDYTAAILAFILKAENVTIWKDVPGVLNADPKYFDDTILIEKMSYLDAIELAYYGTGVIHPKTIKPLQNKGIELNVKSFIDPDSKGTVIGNFSYDYLTPSFIFKVNQVLLRISPHDFSFIEEENMERVYGILYKHGLKINLQQTSAVSFQVVVNNDKRKLRLVVDEMEQYFRVSYETGLELVTIRYFDDATMQRVMANKTLLLEQRGLKNVELLIRDMG